VARIYDAVAALEFGFKVGALAGVKLSGRTIGIEVNVRVRLHPFG
jgi:hypothetical protein